MPTEVQGARLFLNSIMKTSSTSHAASFEKLLSVMEEFRSSSLQNLARRIRQKMDGDEGSRGGGTSDESRGSSSGGVSTGNKHIEIMHRK